MLTVAQALDEVLGRATVLPSRRLALRETLGCVLAEDVAADGDSPPFDKALVDGYAIRAADLNGSASRRFKVGEEITAGRTPSRPLAAGEAALVMTGAPLPAGADAVVMIERTERVGDDLVHFADGPAHPGMNWLPRGREMRAGEVVLKAGERLNAARLGLLAAVGKESVRVVPRPRVAVLPTGDELVEPSVAPGPGQIRNSNATMLAAMAESSGASAEVLPIARDDREELAEALERGLAGSDILLITGGVSAGKLDLVPETLESLGARPVFHKIRLKPGKPLWFGQGATREDGSSPLVFGLPGNPVSGLVCFLLFVRPALAALAGGPRRGPRLARAHLGTRFDHRGDRPTYHPAAVRRAEHGSVLEAFPLEWAGSADLRTVARADGFAAFPAGDCSYEPGQPIDVLLMECAGRIDSA